MLSRRRAQCGMTLVEIGISLVVLGVLVSLAAPAFFQWLQSQQVRVATEAVLNGLQVARAEAIRRNLRVQIAIGPGTGWSVTEAASGTAIQSRVHEEGTSSANITIAPPGATTVTFTPLGGVAPNLDASPAVTQINFDNPVAGSCQPSGAMRCLRVLVSGGGSVKMCDPVVVSPDPRACS